MFAVVFGDRTRLHRDVVEGGALFGLERYRC